MRPDALARAKTAKNWLKRHLLLGAALADALPHECVIVGGTAYAWWTKLDYGATDLDICTPIGPEARQALAALGFARIGRHFEHPEIDAVVEFPESIADGDPRRRATVRFGKQSIQIIGADDLYLDRLRQSTVSEGIRSIEYETAAEFAKVLFRSLDWRYIAKQIGGEPSFLKEAMRNNNTKIRRSARLF